MRSLTNRWRAPATAALVAVAFASCTGNNQPSGPLKLETGASYRFDGWGTSLAWWANVIGAGGGWQPGDRDQVLRSLFGDPNHVGVTIAQQPIDPLGLNILRYNIGASPPAGAMSDLPANCRDFRPGAAVPSPVAAPDAPLDLENDARQIDVLREARKLIDASNAPNELTYLEAFANSPPWWLVDDHCPAGTPNAAPFATGGTASDQYARYLVEVLSAFHDQGVDFATIEPFNEPTNDKPWGSCRGGKGCQEGANFPPEAQAAVIDRLCLDLQPGEHTPLASRVSANDALGFGNLGKSLPTWGERECLGQINVHGYGAGSRASVREAAKGKPLWMSEFGTGPCAGRGDKGETCAGIVLSKQIADDLQYLRPRAWVYWQAVEAVGGWGLLQEANFPSRPARNGDLYPTPRFWALAQYSRYIRGGSTIYPVMRSGDELKPDDNTVRVVVARTDAGQTVVVATNPDDHEQPLSLDLTPIASQGSASVSRVSLAGASPDLSTPAGVALKDAILSDPLPPQTITTYVIGGSARADLSTRSCTTPPLQGEGVSDVRATGISCGYAVHFAGRSRLCSVRTPTSTAGCTDQGWRCAVGPGRLGGIGADCTRGAQRIRWRAGF